jgi:hypothetical protein
MQKWKRITDSSELVEGQCVRYWSVHSTNEEISESLRSSERYPRFYTGKHGWAGVRDYDGALCSSNLFGGQVVEALFDCESYGDMPVLKEKIETKITVSKSELKTCLATLKKIRSDYRNSGERSRAQVIADAENLIATF